MTKTFFFLAMTFLAASSAHATLAIVCGPNEESRKVAVDAPVYFIGEERFFAQRDSWELYLSHIAVARSSYIHSTERQAPYEVSDFTVVVKPGTLRGTKYFFTGLRSCGDGGEGNPVQVTVKRSRFSSSPVTLDCRCDID